MQPDLKLPKPRYRAAPNKPALTTLITAPEPPSFTASQLGPYMYSALPSLDSTALFSLLSELVFNNSAVNAHLLAKYGLTFGTSVDPVASLYMDTAFLGNTLYLLIPYSTSFNCSSLSSVLAATLRSPLALNLLNTPVSCLNVIVSDQPSVSAMDRTVYCGFWQAGCNGTSVTNEYPVSYEFYNATSTSVSFGLYYNGTGTDQNGRPPEYLRLASELSGAMLKNALGGNTTLANAARLLGNMAMPKQSSKLQLDLSSLLGPLFYTWVVQMLLPTFLQLLVYEKEKRLRMMMKMHGLGDGAYWLVTYLWYLMLYIVYMIIFIVFGAGVGLEVFRRSNMGVQIIFYFLFGNNMIAMAFMLSSLFSSYRTSTVVAFLYVFATGLLGELLFKTFMEDNESWMFFVEWVPAFALYRGLWEMSQYAFLGVYQGSRGLDFARLSDEGCGMRATWGIFVVEWAIFMVLGWYLEQVLSSGTGIRRHPLYFLKCCMPRRKAHGGGGGSDSLRLTPGEREDVRAERMRVEMLTEEEAAAKPIVVRNLRKVYPPLDGGKPKVAVRTLTMAIERGECFGLLGPNGAGKSTSINMLTGFLEPSSGSALIEGLDITSQMPKIYSLMGVCPQHDLLWEQLTAEEHLLFYGRLKGLKGAELSNAVTVALKSVNLFNGGVGQKQARKYSGGMKRRLSVAISFIGNPQVVYLDEPSTGLDPASRRNLWDVVRANKDGRAIILTTHSMEEAEILCDRLGIFVDGQLVCIGNPREITSRYAGYLVFTITVGPGHEDAAKAFVAHMSPNSRLTYALGGTFKYELPTADVSLSAVFDAMATAKTQMQVLDWGVANATLEEVFIKFARQIGAETNDQ
ncbi:hypothetical protein VOLCADRAFT_79211 [Volvox carteri f. nagariensis]|uniref:ABC transporter domain-containing protein n=1 Tax=Volvox carteri f. nagariensis TaxID=3068 RepID=D8TJP4_VOLCA|nr:uncharacterized protein VOLCADRAFT_79211 [Volvox carteri f. nagariensis]EFJ52407.1 hypothetical protein VOLCADRAFT_79211 [Volvox carteri f. nagariensis]|eukprot:XP_002946480.1 hypothetical protein VOLCADRAFT_79211 [Volvox carteri f. nagariensis]